MTSPQLDDFITFFETTTGGGSLPFTFPNQEGSGDWIVKFGQNVPSWSRKEAGWLVKIELVVLP